MVKCILELSNSYADLTPIVGFESSIHQSMYTSLKKKKKNVVDLQLGK